MGGEGHMLDMIRRLSEGREASRLRRERANDKLKHLNRTKSLIHCPTPLPRKWDISSRLGEKERKGQQLFRLGDAYYHGSPHCNCRDILGYFP